MRKNLYLYKCPLFCLLCLTVVCSYIFSELEKSEFLKGNPPNHLLALTRKKCFILFIRDQEIKTLKSRPPVEHYILKTIFDNDLNKSVSFYDIAECENDEYRDNWNRYRNACDKLNVKISKQTKK